MPVSQHTTLIDLLSVTHFSEIARGILYGNLTDVGIVLQKRDISAQFNLSHRAKA
ncbi:MAG: hypothetical protein KatS3mg054_1131 [Chloroflexus sp.]|jgi:hypothetical protein|nr:MAG: hypothetical protein KatS3mg054_1131 [Chloroflexus sp.]